mgnify:CR=1 FL=1
MRFPLARLRLAPFLLLALTAACDCGDDDDPTDRPFPTEDMGDGVDGGGDDLGTVEPEPLNEFAADYAAAYCAKVEECYGPGAVDLMIENCAEAIEAELADSLIPNWRAGEDALQLVIDEDAADGCVAAIGATACVDLNTFLADGCDTFLMGQQATGEACTTRQDCPAGDYCAVEATCPGTCTTYAAEGESCESLRCAPGAFCNETTECEALPVAGEACDLDIACSGLLYCATDGDTSPSCRSQDQVFTVAQNEACMLSAAGPFCQDGLSCVVQGDGFVCANRVTAGAVCRVGFPDQCPDGQSCFVEDVVAGMGTCMDAAGEGEACAGLPCGPGLVCGLESETCIPLARLGDACAENSECGSVICESGVCMSPGCIF